MGQLGSKIKRLIELMLDNYNMDSPFLFYKLDISGGFWRLVASHLQAWNLCYVLPVVYGRPVSLGKAERFVPI